MVPLEHNGKGDNVLFSQEVIKEHEEMWGLKPIRSMEDLDLDEGLSHLQGPNGKKPQGMWQPKLEKLEPRWQMYSQMEPSVCPDCMRAPELCQEGTPGHGNEMNALPNLFCGNTQNFRHPGLKWEINDLAPPNWWQAIKEVPRPCENNRLELFQQRTFPM